MCIVGHLKNPNPDSHLSNPQTRYDNELEEARKKIQKCPYCGTVGQMEIHSYYYRQLRISKNSDPVDLRVGVFHCGCETCKHPYHAFLPSWICPFWSFTYVFLTEILGYFYGDAGKRIKTTADRFNLPRSTIYRLVDHYSAEDARIMQTEWAKDNQWSRERIILRLARSKEDLERFLLNFLHVNSESFFTRHFPLSSCWSFIKYGIWAYEK